MTWSRKSADTHYQGLKPNVDFKGMFAPWLHLWGFSLFPEKDLSVVLQPGRAFICEDVIIQTLFVVEGMLGEN